MQRSKVVLPQPDGPSRQTSSPAATSRETLSSAVKAPKRLRTPRTFIGAPGLARALAIELFMDGPHLADEGHAREGMRRLCGNKAKAADSGIGEFGSDRRHFLGQPEKRRRQARGFSLLEAIQV